MKKAHFILRDLLVFFFVIEVFSSVIEISNNRVVDRILYGLVFAGVMILAPHILKFFKIPVSDWALAVTSVLMVSIYLYIGRYLLSFVRIPSTTLNLNTQLINPVKLGDEMVVIVLVGSSLALFSIAMQLMSKRKKSSIE